MKKSNRKATTHRHSASENHQALDLLSQAKEKVSTLSSSIKMPSVSKIKLIEIAAIAVAGIVIWNRRTEIQSFLGSLGVKTPESMTDVADKVSEVFSKGTQKADSKGSKPYDLKSMLHDA